MSRQTPLVAMNDLLVDLKRHRSNAELVAALAPVDPVARS
jgi:hypothetical protein